MTYNRPCQLDKGYKTDSFDCGNEELNQYLKQFAFMNHQSGASKAHVILDDEQNIIAYYTLSTTSIQKEGSPTRLNQTMPDPVPAVLIGRFAVDSKHQRQGLGKALLKDAFTKIAMASDDIGIRAIVIDAKDERAKTYYIETCGFTTFDEEGKRVYMLIKDLKKSLKHLPVKQKH